MSAKLSAAIGFLATIVAANLAVQHFGVIPVGFGLLAPAGVLFVGLGFTLRDLTQRAFGTPATIAVIAAGAGLSFLVTTPALAVASAMAFGLSEFADLAVYTPLVNRGREVLAVALSNTVGLIIDSAVFLWLAFGSLQFFPGQVVGKAWMTLPVIAYLWVRSRRQVMLA